LCAALDCGWNYLFWVGGGMSDIDQGGFVYPHITYEYGEEVHHKGIALRDHLAGIAMNGILAGDHPITHEVDCIRKIVSAAYEIADAMIEARKK
jgi:hypothetical protein